jgi:hypothetical protein
MIQVAGPSVKWPGPHCILCGSGISAGAIALEAIAADGSAASSAAIKQHKTPLPMLERRASQEVVKNSQHTLKRVIIGHFQNPQW